MLNVGVTINNKSFTVCITLRGQVKWKSKDMNLMCSCKEEYNYMYPGKVIPLICVLSTNQGETATLYIGTSNQ